VASSSALIDFGLDTLVEVTSAEWADPVAALVIASVAVKEGRDAWRGDSCCTLSHEGDD
jgi:hypothetical protein